MDVKEIRQDSARKKCRVVVQSAYLLQTRIVLPCIAAETRRARRSQRHCLSDFGVARVGRQAPYCSDERVLSTVCLTRSNAHLLSFFATSHS